MLAGLPQDAQDSLGQQVPFPPRLGDPAEYAALALPHRREPDAERRDHPPRRRDPHGAEIGDGDGERLARPGRSPGSRSSRWPGSARRRSPALMLAEMGARVVRIERDGKAPLAAAAAAIRSRPAWPRRSCSSTSSSRDGVGLVLRLVERADVLIEGFRPGVMERLGLGPDEALAANPRLVYARMTGFGQDGPLAGARRPRPDLSRLVRRAACDRREGPQAGAAAQSRRRLWRRRDVPDRRRARRPVRAAAFRQGPGGRRGDDRRRLDAGGAHLSPSWRPGCWQDRRGDNLLDGGAPFYDTYETADGGHVAVACLEPQFFAEFARLLPLDAGLAARQYDRAGWDEHARRDRRAPCCETAARRMGSAVRGTRRLRRAGAVAGRGAARTRTTARETCMSDAGGFERPAPAPRFSRSRSQAAQPPDGDGRDPATILAASALSADRSGKRLPRPAQSPDRPQRVWRTHGGRQKKRDPRDRRRGDPARQDAAPDRALRRACRCSTRNPARRWQAGSPSRPISTARR